MNLIIGFFLVFLTFIGIGCNVDNSGRTVYTIINNDTVNLKIETFDSLGNLVRICYEYDSLMHGIEQEFYPNGKKKVEGNWYRGKKVGWFKYYGEKGQLQVLREYVAVNDHDNWKKNHVAYLNQVIRFNESGDTIKNGSFFITQYKTADTIRNGDSYAFKVMLNAAFFKEMVIVLCDFDELYSLLPGGSCDSFNVEGFQRAFSPKSYKLGENFIRGKVLNYEEYIDSLGGLRERIATIYFTRKFYVVQ